MKTEDLVPEYRNQSDVNDNQIDHTSVDVIMVILWLTMKAFRT